MMAMVSGTDKRQKHQFVRMENTLWFGHGVRYRQKIKCEICTRGKDIVILKKGSFKSIDFETTFLLLVWKKKKGN
jgi:hypothetical protein